MAYTSLKFFAFLAVLMLLYFRLPWKQHRWVVLLAGSFGLLVGSGRAFYRSAYPRRYAEYVEQSSREFGMDEALVYAVIYTESGFDPRVQSSVGAPGLMQITEEKLV